MSARLIGDRRTRCLGEARRLVTDRRLGEARRLVTDRRFIEVRRLGEARRLGEVLRRLTGDEFRRDTARAISFVIWI